MRFGGTIADGIWRAMTMMTVAMAAAAMMVAMTVTASLSSRPGPTAPLRPSGSSAVCSRLRLRPRGSSSEWRGSSGRWSRCTRSGGPSIPAGRRGWWWMLIVPAVVAVLAVLAVLVVAVLVVPPGWDVAASAAMLAVPPPAVPVAAGCTGSGGSGCAKFKCRPKRAAAVVVAVGGE